MENVVESKKVIGVAQVLQHLKDGMTREDIALHYGITNAECKILFKHKDLIGKKTIKKPSFVIVDDAENAPEVEETVVEDAAEVEVEAPKEVEVEDTTIPVDNTPARDVFGSTTTDTEEEEEEEEVAPVETEKAKATWD